jgi:hypothetical protein
MPVRDAGAARRGLKRFQLSTLTVTAAPQDGGTQGSGRT